MVAILSRPQYVKKVFLLPPRSFFGLMKPWTQECHRSISHRPVTVSVASLSHCFVETIVRRRCPGETRGHSASRGQSLQPQWWPPDHTNPSDWNGKIVMLTKFSSLAALEAVILATFSATNNKNLICRTIVVLSWCYVWLYPTLISYRILSKWQHFSVGVQKLGRFLQRLNFDPISYVYNYH